MMKSKSFVLLLVMLAFASPIRSLGQEAKQETPLLTLDDAVSIALAHNRLVKNSVLEAQKFDFQVSTMRSRRLPNVHFSVLGGELLQPFDFTFAKGVFRELSRGRAHSFDKRPGSHAGEVDGIFEWQHR